MLCVVCFWTKVQCRLGTIFPLEPKRTCLCCQKSLGVKPCAQLSSSSPAPGTYSKTSLAATDPTAAPVGNVCIEKSFFLKGSDRQGLQILSKLQDLWTRNIKDDSVMIFVSPFETHFMWWIMKWQHSPALHSIISCWDNKTVRPLQFFCESGIKSP